MTKFPKLESARLTLQELTHLDIPTIVEYAGDKRIADNTLNLPHPYEEKDAIFWLNSAYQGFVEGSQYTFGIKLKLESQFVGGVGLRVNKRDNKAELGYWVAVPFWNNGYATEAVGAILKFGFETLNLNKILATHLIENPASGEVMIKNGMVLEGELKDHIKKDGQYLSLKQYRLTRDEYKTF